jgi:hypothetical protein
VLEIGRSDSSLSVSLHPPLTRHGPKRVDVASTFRTGLHESLILRRKGSLTVLLPPWSLRRRAHTPSSFSRLLPPPLHQPTCHACYRAHPPCSLVDPTNLRFCHTLGVRKAVNAKHAIINLVNDLL